MITIEQQQKLLLVISKELKKPVTAYAIGGTAMMFLGLKDATLDIDLVFEKEADKNTFKDAAKKFGYREMDAAAVYGAKKNRPEMLKLNDERFDLFVTDVIDFIFSETMRERAKQMHQFEDKLVLKIADPHDLILMKCATDRVKDIDDARTIIKITEINWNILVEEAKKQISLGKERAAFDLGCFLENLRKEDKKLVPKKTLDALFEIVRKQSEQKQNQEKRHT